MIVFDLIAFIFYLIWLYRAEENLNRMAKKYFNPCCDVFLCLLPGIIFDFIFLYRLSSAFQEQLVTLDRKNRRKENGVPMCLLILFLITGLPKFYSGELFYSHGQEPDAQIFIAVQSCLSYAFFFFALRKILEQERAVEELWDSNSTDQNEPECESPDRYQRPSRSRESCSCSTSQAVDAMEQFFEAYSFDDPSRAHELWMDMSERAKQLIAISNPQAADVMEQADEEMEEIY